MRKYFILLYLVFCIHTLAPAQFYPTQYRPPQQWQQLETPHFKVVYDKGNDSTALKMAQILEEQYPTIQQFVGGQLASFPVILNDDNDRSNGFVTPFHFRSEIELPPIKGKSLNPQTGGWLKNVGPHELVHALHFSNLGSYNIPRFISLFSPDMARSFHGAIPAGATEGMAVYHETENVVPRGGRGHFPIFQNQFNAVFDSDRRWSMGQMVHISSRTRPLNRHYVGGYMFTSWLQDTYGYETTRKALAFYMNYPFLGYGVALRHSTGFWPAQLHDQFEEDHRRALNDGEQKAAHATRSLSIPFKGREIRRPKWLSDTTLVFYGSFYNARAGFYRYNLESEELKRIITTNSVGDYRYDLSADQSTMVYSYYDSDIIYDNTYSAELVEYDFSTDKRQQISEKGRLYSPLYFNDQVLALQTRPASSALVTIEPDRSRNDPKIEEVFSSAEAEITAVSRHPEDNRLAVIANRNGLQGIWITDPENLESALSGTPDISFDDGSVFDPEWHPEGQDLLFSSGYSGTHQLYKYNLQSESVIQITQSKFNAFEGAYSPDGSHIAYIRQQENERLPVVLDQSVAAADTINDALWRPSENKTAAMHRSAVADSIVTASENWGQPDPYSPGSGWLKPRTILPTVHEVSNRNRYQLGLALHSNNLLQNQAYSAEISYLDEQLWYDLSYANKQFYPGFNLSLYSEPSYFRFNTSQNNSFTLLRENRSLALSVPFDFQLNQNIFSTSLFVEPEFRYSQIRFRDVGLANSTSDFATSAVSNLYAQFNVRLQQNIRDVQPNSGMILFSEIEHYWSASDLQFSNGQNDFELTFRQPTALQGGIIGFLSPLRRWNQSLRLELEGLTQSGPVFNNQSLVSDAFSEPVLIGSNNLLSLTARYAIPLVFADDGGFLLPFYLNNLYLVAFSNTVTDPSFPGWYEQSRSVFGLELRTQFRVSNLSFDLGVGYGYEPTRQKHQFFIGSF